MKKRLILLALAAGLYPSLLVTAQDDPYAARRKAVLENLDGGFAVLFSDAAPGDFNKNFFYLTGTKEPNAALVLIPGADLEEVLFSRVGEWPVGSSAPSAAASPREELSAQLSRNTRGREPAYVSFDALDALPEVGGALSRASAIRNIDGALAELRAIKDPFEIGLLREACRITVEGLNDVFMALEPGMREEELAVLLEFGFKLRKSPGFSFLQAASGPNSTNVHFGAGERVLEDGDMIVFDVGAIWNDYTADISRTVPASGTFSQAQREIYNVVLNSQKAGIRLMKPGIGMSEVRAAAEDALIEGLHDLGLVLDPEDQAQRRFFIAHGYFHFIGLDIHDVWSEFGRLAGERSYEPGMVMTMEPGLYFPADGIDAALGRVGSGPEGAAMRTFLETIRPVYEKYANMGVRIEDDVLITPTGNEVLTSGVPKEVEEIEALMAQGSPFGVIPRLR